MEYGLQMKKKSKRKRRRFVKMSDADLLTLLSGPRYVVDTLNGVIKSTATGLSLFIHVCHRGYAHVRLYDGNKERRVAVHKAVWMRANRQCVPAGFELHHGERGKEFNGISNILLREGCEHSWYHTYKASTALREQFKTYDDYRAFRRAQPVSTLESFYAEFD